MSNIDRFFPAANMAGGGSSGFSNQAFFTSAGTFTVPDGVYMLYITMIGGGSGGGRSTSVSGDTSAAALRGGGSASWIAYMPYPVTPGQNIGYTVGAAGIGTPAITSRSFGQVIGGVGGASTFGYMTVQGGEYNTLTANPIGLVQTYSAGIYSKGVPGGQPMLDAHSSQQVASAPNLEFPGSLSGIKTASPVAQGGGAGASSPWGQGGYGSDAGIDVVIAQGGDASGYGAGGGSTGARKSTSSNKTMGRGGNGSQGFVMVNW